MSENGLNNEPNTDEEVTSIQIVPSQDDSDAGDYADAMAVQSVIRENNELYTELAHNRKIFRKMLVVVLALVLLLALMFIGFMYYPKTKWIATKDNAAICEVYPTDNPNITDATIREFAKTAILDMYSIDYVNYQKQLNDVLERYFTTNGRQATVRALDEGETISYLTSNALTFSASASNAARIEQRGINRNGNTYWTIRFPMVLDIYSGKSTPIDTQRHMVTVRVVADRASSSNPNGLGISSVTLSPLQ